MSSNDLSNPQVLRNSIKGKILECDGKIEVRREEVTIFKANDGNEYVVPQDLVEELKLKEEKKKALPAKKK